MRCDLCGAQGPVVDVELNHNVGMLVMRQTYTTQGKLCRSCLNRAMFGHTWKNLLLGWWGTISFLLTGFYLIRNAFVFVGAHLDLNKGGKQLADSGGARLPSASSSGARVGGVPGGGPQTAAQKLQPFENNVKMELRRGALPYDVAEGLVTAHGVDFDSAYDFVKQIKKQMEEPQGGAPPSSPSNGSGGPDFK